MIDYAVARANMVENQLRPSRIDDPGVLQAMGEIPRELFVPKALRGCAYGDEDLALGQGRFLIEPLALGKLLQASEPRPATWRWWSATPRAMSRRSCPGSPATVFLLRAARASPAEPIEALLGELGCDNVVLQQGRADQGHPDQAPFDLIVLVGSVPAVPPALLEQLGEAGGSPPWSSTAAAAR